MPVLFQINVTANWGSTGRIAEEIGQLTMEHGLPNLSKRLNKLRPNA